MNDHAMIIKTCKHCYFEHIFNVSETNSYAYMQLDILWYSIPFFSSILYNSFEKLYHWLLNSLAICHHSLLKSSNICNRHRLLTLIKWPLEGIRVSRRIINFTTKTVAAPDIEKSLKRIRKCWLAIQFTHVSL